MKSYEAITRRGQIGRMRVLADMALQFYAIQPERIEALAHGENTLFRVTARSEECSESENVFVLRIHVNHPEYRSAEAVRSEMLWLKTLRSDAGLGVPEPVPARDGSLVVRASAEGIPGERSCVLLRWTAGRFVKGRRRESPSLWARVGRFLARMHIHAVRFVAPPGFVRTRYDGVRSYYGIAFDDMFRELVPRHPACDLNVMRRTVDRGRAAIDAIGKGPMDFGMIHADLHGGNFLVHHGEVQAIDFDECGFGLYLYDLAVVARYFSDRQDLREALLGAYLRVRSLPTAHEHYFDDLIELRRMNEYVWIYGNQSNDSRMHGDPVARAQALAEGLRKRGI